MAQNRPPINEVKAYIVVFLTILRAGYKITTEIISYIIVFIDFYMFANDLMYYTEYGSIFD